MPRYDSNEIGARDDETVMSKVKLTRVEALFYSPLIFFEIPDCEALNRQLLEETDAMRARSSGVTKSNKKGWHSDVDFFHRTEPGCTALRKHIVDAVCEATKRLSPNFDFKSNELQMEGWINVNPPGAFNAPHTHPSFALSGTYYVKIPSESVSTAPDVKSGTFEFIDPRVNAGSMSIEGATCFDPGVTVKPKDGLMIIFPSYLRHWVYPNEEESERVSIAFNIRYIKRGAAPASAGADSGADRNRG
jgi:uncharacterized protein (TIGR02466 family)